MPTHHYGGKYIKLQCNDNNIRIVIQEVVPLSLKIMWRTVMARKPDCKVMFPSINMDS